MNIFRSIRSLSAFGAIALLHHAAFGQLVISDTLNGASSSFNWQSLNGACLTAGDGTGSIPACVGLPYYAGKTQVGGTTGRLPDAVGSGALRLTNGDTKANGANGNSQSGAVVSNFTFPTNLGLQVTFKTVTYGGNGYNTTGADGIGFFLSDGAQVPTVGGLGGSLGYSCSNTNDSYDGVVGGYVGIGIDEFGNFSNRGDNTDQGSGQIPGRISMRGAGNTAWASLNLLRPTWYPTGTSSAGKKTAVTSTCKSGYLWNFSGGNITDANGNVISNGNQTTERLAFNYPILGGITLPSTDKLYNQESMSMPLRGGATPVTYSVNLTQDGYLDFSYSIRGGSAQTVINHQLITASNGPLPTSFRFGFSSGTGSGSNVHEITCFKAAPSNTADSSAGTNVQQSARVEQGTQVYLAYYHPLNSWGQLAATSLVADPTTGAVSLALLSNWDASCVLSGGACQATSVAVTAQGSSARNILSWNGSAGIPFQWSNLTTGTGSQQAALTAGDASVTDIRLRYLRGDRTNEIAQPSGTLRTRAGVLGDIVDSSPTWVGAPSAPYGISWGDIRYPAAAAAEASGQTYAAYMTANATRTNVVYVGANDGMLHGFRAGFSDASGAYQGASNPPNDGLEVLAYVPAAILSTLHSTTPSLDFSGTQYSHNFYVDATPGVGDLYYAGKWHTWLIGGAGFGGNATGPVGDDSTTANGVLFGLDITDPTKFQESLSASLVLGEWTSATLACVSGGGGSGCGTNLGSSVGTPIIRRLHSGNWAVLFGNGLNSASGTAGMFIMLVDSTGGKTFRYIDTGYGPAQDPSHNSLKNGIAYVASADLDGDHITDFVYAGDEFGNLWRFDLTDSDPTKWVKPTAPIFSTAVGQPITTRVNVNSVPTTGGQPRVIISFGTGQQMPQTSSSAATYSTATQALFGIWDWNLSTWNTNAPSTARYASLTAPQTVTTSTLAIQTLTTVPASGSTPSYRTVGNAPICWSGTAGCTGTTGKFGWTLALPGASEQIVFNPVTAFGMFIVNTTIPSVTQTLSCDVQPASGYTMAVTVAGGGAASQSFFGNANGNFSNIGGAIVTGIGLSATGSPSIVTSKKLPYLVQQTTGGTGVVTAVNPGASGLGKRLNWTELR